MKKQTYLQGLQYCEKMHKEGNTVEQLKAFLEQEESIVDYKWDNWCDGFSGGIDHFERLEKLNL